MDTIVFVAWLLVFSALLMRSPFYSKWGLPPVWMLGIFLLKIGAGALYAWFFLQLPDYQTKVDTWRYFLASLPERDWLLHDPAGFFADLVTPRYANDAGLLGTQNSLLNDLKEVLVIKLAAIFNLFSGSRYYVNLIFYNYLILFGQVALGILWSKVFQLHSSKWMVAGIALFPSVLFWTSGFHRDGLLLHCLGWTLWLAYRIWKKGKPDLLLSCGFVLHFGLLFLLRNYLAVLLLAAMAMGMLAYSLPAKAKWLVPLVLATGLAGMILIGELRPAFSLPKVLATRQQEFLGLTGDSKVGPLPVGNGWMALLQSVPEALRRFIAAPFPGLGLKASEWPPAIENIVWLLSILPALWFGRKRLHTPTGTGWLVLSGFVVLAIGLITGLTIPFIGAIARYKSLMWPFMAPPVLFWWGSMAVRWWTKRSAAKP